MFKNMFIKIKNVLNYFMFLIFRPLVKKNKNKIIPGTLLIVRLDAIGDYILFRNYLKIIRESNAYKDCKITLCGNIIWKDLAENLDGDVVDDFIWIERENFYNNIFYKISVLKTIYKKGFETAIHPVYTREILYGDEIVWASNAPVKIGSRGAADKHSKWKKHFVSDDWYTKLVPVSKEHKFEFYRNKEFFEKLFETKLNLQRPILKVDGVTQMQIPDKDYVLLFPGAGVKERLWDISNYYSVANYLIEKLGIYIAVAGGRSEKELAGFFLDKPGSEMVIDFTGKTSLLQLAVLISKAKLIISNETGAIHIAAAANIPFICISNGQHYGRFHPYPEEIFKKGYYLYPEGFKINSSDAGETSEEFRYGSVLNINTVSPLDVINLCDKILLQ